LLVALKDDFKMGLVKTHTHTHTHTHTMIFFQHMDS